MGIAFIEERKVAFRERVPALHVVLHELGHIYFEETDPVWNTSYGGGEFLMWLIIKGHMEGNEENIREWHSLMKLGYENPEKLYEKLDEVALKVGKEVLGEDLSGLKCVEGFGLGEKHRRPIYELALWTGTLPSGDSPFFILVNVLEGTRYGELLWRKALEELIA